MTKAEDLINYYRTPKIAIDEKFQSFFDEVYKLSSLEIHAKIHKLTKGFNRLDQLIGMYNLYNSYIYFKSDPIFLKEMGEDEFTLFTRQFDVVKLNELTVITLHNDQLVFEPYELLKHPNIDVYKIQTFSEILEQLINSEYVNTKPQQGEPEPLDLSEKAKTAVEKIIYLNELGIIDFLKTKTEFIGSTNLMATFLSAITDVKASTLQTSLNKLINNDTDDKNHPYRTTKTVERVRQTLIDKNIKPKTS